jgi:hypothetical protein
MAFLPFSGKGIKGHLEGPHDNLTKIPFGLSSQRTISHKIASIFVNMLSEGSQMEKAMYCLILLIRNIQNGQSIKTESGSVLVRGWGMRSGFKSWL